MIQKFALLGLLFVSTAAPQANRTVLEKKVPFQVRMQAEDEQTELALCGTAVRDKRVVFNFDVYAYGLYVDAKQAPQVLARWKGKSKKALQADGGLYSELCKDNFTKSLRLVFLRDVDSNDVEEAFRDALEPRIALAHTKYEMPDARKELSAFRKLFGKGTFEKGDELVLTWRPKNQLLATVKGKRQEPIQSGALCWALFDVYLGADPIEEKGKQTLIARLPDLLR